MKTYQLEELVAVTKTGMDFADDHRRMLLALKDNLPENPVYEKLAKEEQDPANPLHDCEELLNPDDWTPMKGGYRKNRDNGSDSQD